MDAYTVLFMACFSIVGGYTVAGLSRRRMHDGRRMPKDAADGYAGLRVGCQGASTQQT